MAAAAATAVTQHNEAGKVQHADTQQAAAQQAGAMEAAKHQAHRRLLNFVKAPDLLSPWTSASSSSLEPATASTISTDASAWPWRTQLLPEILSHVHHHYEKTMWKVCCAVLCYGIPEGTW